MKKALFGLAESEAQAASIVNQLKGAAFLDNDISVLFPDKAETRHFAHEQHTKAPEGVAAGGGGGAVRGGAPGWLVGVGTLVIPGVGPFIAAGPIVSALADAGAGAAAGGLTGALIGMGMPEYEAKQYEGKIKGGNILISVHTEDGTERTRAKEIFKNARRGNGSRRHCGSSLTKGDFTLNINRPRTGDVPRAVEFEGSDGS